MNFLTLLVDRQNEILLALREHLVLVFVPVGLAALVTIPLGILATRYKWIEVPVMNLANIFQTIPSLALLALMIPLGLGIGQKPALVALFLYSLLPILRNTYIGIRSVDDSVIQAARGMGMTYFQRLYMVELPIAIPVIMGGIRTATVIIIGTATLAAMIGGGGLGDFIVTGLGMVRDELILLGAVPAAILALLAEFVLGRLENILTPRGLRISREH
ncbi:MAG: ABC transporter permease [Bacillota bacterium]|jgi:osmoprotectant transport system permease protein|nr:ABC transporter permease [Bacillota bacterium]HHT91721.1 ABC transporter permease [Bacillota bacterium]